MRFLKDLIPVVLTALVLILALEAGLRVARDRYQASFYQSEAERGYSLRPNAEGWNILDGEAYVRVNSAGLRDRERQMRRPAHALRVAVVGSSDAAALEVPFEDMFETGMERNLAPVFAQRRNRLEVINFGVPGYSLAQQYLTLNNHVWGYDPQVVVVVWNQYNILRNTLQTSPDGALSAPFYVLRNGRLEPAGPAPAESRGSSVSRKIAIKNRLADWTNRSYLLSMLHQAAVELQNRINGLRVTLRAHAAVAPAAASARPPDYGQWWPYLPSLPEVQEDWQIAEAFLRQMKEDCDRHGAELQVVIVDEQMQSHPDLEVRKAFMRRRGLPSLDESDHRVERFCEKNGIGVFPLAPSMGAYAVAHSIALHGSGKDNAGHWNILGHRIVGRLISEELLTGSAVVRAWRQGPHEDRAHSTNTGERVAPVR
jgi:hypothetical protein